MEDDSAPASPSAAREEMPDSAALNGETARAAANLSSTQADARASQALANDDTVQDGVIELSPMSATAEVGARAQVGANADMDGIEITGSSVAGPSRQPHMNGRGSAVGAPWADGAAAQAGPSYHGSPHRNGLSNGHGGTNGGGSYNGASASSAIDLTSGYVPAPSQHVLDPRRPICIGAIMSRVFSIYPPEIAVVGAQPPSGTKERLHMVNLRGADLIKVKLKVSPVEVTW